MPLLPYRHPVSWDLSLLQCLNSEYYGFFGVEMSWTQMPKYQKTWSLTSHREHNAVQEKTSNNGRVFRRKSSITVGRKQEMLHFSVSEHNATRRAIQEDETRMKRRWGEETRTDIIWRTVGLPALIPHYWQIGTMAALARMPSHAFPPRNLSVSTV